MKGGAIVVCVEGVKYRAAFDRIFLPGIRDFALRHQYELIVVAVSEVRERLRGEPANATLAKVPPSWLKLFAIESVQARGFRHILYLDADVFVSAVAEDYFALLPEETVSAIIEETIPVTKAHLWREACGLAPSEDFRMINAGVMYLSGDAGAAFIWDVIAFIRENRTKINFRTRVFEQPIVSDFMLRHPAFKRMRYLYNTLLYSDRGHRLPEVQRIRSTVNRFCSRVPPASRLRTIWFSVLFRMCGTYARGNRTLMSSLLDEGRFIHFAGMNDEFCITRSFIRR